MLKSILRKSNLLLLGLCIFLIVIYIKELHTYNQTAQNLTTHYCLNFNFENATEHCREIIKENNKYNLIPFTKSWIDKNTECGEYDLCQMSDEFYEKYKNLYK